MREGLSKGVFEKGVYRIWAVLGDLAEGSKQQSFALELILSVSTDNSMTGYHSQSFLEGGRNEARLNL